MGAEGLLVAVLLVGLVLWALAWYLAIGPAWRGTCVAAIMVAALHLGVS